MKVLRTLAVRWIILLLAFPLGSCLAQARFRQSNAEYQSRRAKLRAVESGPVVVFGYTGHEDASEQSVFFQEESFYYLTGDNEPGAALLLIPDAPDGKPVDGPREVLYLPPRDRAQEKWEGPKMGQGDAGLAEKPGFEVVEPFANLQGDLTKLAKTYPNVYQLLPPSDDERVAAPTVWSGWIREVLPQSKVEDIAPVINAMRQMKSPGELELIQKA